MAVFTTSVRTIADGTNVEAANINGPISDLTNRTTWLRDQLSAITAGTQLVLRNRTIESGLAVGDVVYYDDTSGSFKGALSDVDTSNLSTASDSSFWQGVLQVASGTSGDVVLGGSMTLTQVEWAAAYESGVFAAGDVFLSSVTPGKLNTVPGTTGIYIGHMLDDGSGNGELLVRLGNPGSFIDHIHLERTLLGEPAGSVVDPAFGDPQVITTPDPLQAGWLPANSTYFPGFIVGVQIPTGAVFGYNITHPSETALAEVFPLIPEDNAQFSQSGLILYGDHVVANRYGIWWMDNSYGEAPWPVDYGITGVAADITLWTARLVASASVLELVEQSVINSLDNGGIDTIAVQSLLSASTDDLGISGTEGDGTNGWQGQVTLENNGVTALRLGRGLGATAPSGNNITGYKKLVDLRFDADLPAQHLFTSLDGANSDPSEKLKPLTTNGVSSGTSITAYGHRLGAVAADYIDFLIPAGSDLPAATDFEVTISINACVDTIAAAPVPGTVDVSFYRLINGSPVSTTQLQRTEQATFNTGLPGQLQTVSLGPYADVVVQQGDTLLVRIDASGGSPLPSDTFRLLSIYYNMDPA